MLAQYLSYEFIALFMFITMLVMMFTGQRVFGAIGFVAAASALLVWGDGSLEMPYTATWKLFKWYPMLTLPLFIYMGFMISESGIASDLYKMFHVLFGGLKGGLAIGTMFMMVAISAMNGLSVAGMAIGATIAIPEMLKRNYDKRMITGVVQAGSSLGILIPPSVVMVLYGMIARQPVSKLWMAGILPGLLMASLFLIYIYVRCKLQPELGPPLPKKDRNISTLEKIKLLKAGVIPFLIFFLMTGLFLMGIASLVECSAVGALLATLASIYKKRFNRKVLDATLKKTLGVSCMFMWIILAALTFGAVFDGLGAPKPSNTAPKVNAANIIHMNIQETPNVFFKVASKTFLLNLFLYIEASVAKRAPTAEHSTKLAIPIKNNPVIRKKIRNGITPALSNLIFSKVEIFLSFLGKGGPSSGCSLHLT